MMLWEGKSLHNTMSLYDLRSSDNDISVWKNDGSQEQINKLALAFELTTGRITDMNYINIPDKELEKKGFEFHEEQSSTPFLPMREFHTNIIIPTLYELGDLAEIIYNLIQSGECKYITEREIKETFYKAIKADEIIIDFNNRKFRSLRKPLKEMENEMEPIDFSELQNVKDIDKRRKVCPKCNGSGFVFLN